MARHISIDLGTSNTVISEKNKGVILCQPTVAAIDNSTQRIVAVGNEAKELLGKTPKEVCVVSPVKSGVVADFDATCAMLKVFLSSILPKGAIRPRATVCIPPDLTQVEKHTLLEAVSRSGARFSCILESPIASLIGAGVEVSQPEGNMILDIGGGKTCAAVVSFGGIVSSACTTSAGNEMDKQIANYIKKNHAVLIGEKTAEEIKIKIGTAHPDTHEKSLTVMGRCEKTGLPRELSVTSAEVYEAILPTLSKIADTVTAALQNSPAELISDLSKKGILLCGGGANLAGLDLYLENNLGIGATLLKEAMVCSAVGGCADASSGVMQ